MRFPFVFNSMKKKVSKIETVDLGTGILRVTHYVPDLPNDKREELRRFIERELYPIFTEIQKTTNEEK